MSEELNKLLNEYKSKIKNGLITTIRYNKDLQNEIISLTSFLDKEYNISARIYCLYNNINEQPVCPICGKNVPFHKMNRGFYKTCQDKICIDKLVGLKSSISNKTRDWEAIVQKIKNTNLERYGAVSNLSKNTESRKIADDKLFQKYGVYKPLQIKEAVDKFKNTYNTNKQDYYINKLNNMNLSVENYDISTGIFKLKCNKCNNIIDNIHKSIIRNYDETNISPCEKCFPINKTRSNLEFEVFTEIQKFYTKTIIHNKRYKGFEIDLELPDANIGIECNGLYWHSELFKTKTYHRDKKINYENTTSNSLITIWEDDWHNKQKREIILSRLKSKLNLSKCKIYARKCKIKLVNGKDANKFLTNNHLHGYVASSINIGLYYNNVLVQICTFKKARKLIGNNSGYELIRSASILNTNIIGGFSKIIKYFVNNYSTELYSYVDTDWASLKNNAYEKNNFIIKEHTKEGYSWYVKNLGRQHRLNYTKQKLVNMGYDKNKSETTIMHELGNIKIYDNGNLLCVYNKKGESL